MTKTDQLDEKGLVKEAARAYIAEYHPEELKEFEQTFDFLHRALEIQSDDRLTDTGMRAAPSPDGVGAIAETFAAQTILAACVGTAWLLVRFALKYLAKYHVLPNLDTWSERLSEVTKQKEMVQRIREIVESDLQGFVGKKQN